MLNYYRNNSSVRILSGYYNMSIRVNVVQVWLSSYLPLKDKVAN